MRSAAGASLCSTWSRMIATTYSPRGWRGLSDARCAASPILPRRSAGFRRNNLVAIHHDLAGRRFRRPDFALAPVDLAHVGGAAGGAEALELLRRRIEAQHRLPAPLRCPHLVGLVDVHRVEMRIVAGRAPCA